MYARIRIGHKPGNAVACLEAATGMPHSPSTILQSSFPGALEHAASGTVLYSAANASWVVFTAAALHTQLQLVVSSKHGDVKQACEDIWHAFRSTGKALSPRLLSMEVLDQTSTTAIATGETGAAALISRFDFKVAVWPGVLTILLIGLALGIGRLNSDDLSSIWFAGAPAILVSVVAVGLLIRHISKKEVVWTG